jgi:hypothetical protein
MWQRQLQEILSLDDYFAQCVRMEQGINSKERVRMKKLLADYLKNGGNALDLEQALITEEAKNQLLLFLLNDDASTPQEAQKRVAIKRQLREYNVSFDNNDSTEFLQKQLATADFLHNFGNAISIVHLKAQHGKPITLEHIQKLCSLYEEFRDVMLIKNQEE